MKGGFERRRIGLVHNIISWCYAAEQTSTVSAGRQKEAGGSWGTSFHTFTFNIVDDIVDQTYDRHNGGWRGKERRGEGISSRAHVNNVLGYM